MWRCSIAHWPTQHPAPTPTGFDGIRVRPWPGLPSPLRVSSRKPLLRCCCGCCARRRLLPSGKSTLKVSYRRYGLCFLVRVAINQVCVDSGGGPLCGRGGSTDELRARKSCHGRLHCLIGRRGGRCWSCSVWAGRRHAKRFAACVSAPSWRTSMNFVPGWRSSPNASRGGGGGGPWPPPPHQSFPFAAHTLCCFGTSGRARALLALGGLAALLHVAVLSFVACCLVSSRVGMLRCVATPRALFMGAVYPIVPLGMAARCGFLRCVGTLRFVATPRSSAFLASKR